MSAIWRCDSTTIIASRLTKTATQSQTKRQMHRDQELGLKFVSKPYWNKVMAPSTKQQFLIKYQMWSSTSSPPIANCLLTKTSIIPVFKSRGNSKWKHSPWITVKENKYRIKIDKRHLVMPLWAHPMVYLDLSMTEREAEVQFRKVCSIRRFLNTTKSTPTQQFSSIKITGK